MPAAMVISTNTVPDSTRFLRWGFYTTSWGDGVVIAAFPGSRRPKSGTQGFRSGAGPRRPQSGGSRPPKMARIPGLRSSAVRDGKIFPPGFRSEAPRLALRLFGEDFR